MGNIYIRGARERNLKDIDLDLPKGRLVSLTGVSGSGKSSLAFDTIYAESFRRFSDASGLTPFIAGRSAVARHGRPACRSILGLPPALGLSQRQGVAGPLSTVGTLLGVTDLLRVYFAAFSTRFCRSCDIPLEATPFQEILHAVSVAFAEQMVTVVAPIAERRRGSFAKEIESFRKLGFSRLRVNGVVVSLQDDESPISIDHKKLNTVELVIDRLRIDAGKEQRLERALVEAMSQAQGVVQVEGGTLTRRFNSRAQCPQCGESAQRLDPRFLSHSSLGQCTACAGLGVADGGRAADLDPCQQCQGTRLSSDIPRVRVGGVSFDETQRWSLLKLGEYVEGQLLSHAGRDRARWRVASEVARLLSASIRLGLGHLSLGREGRSLVPGDLQRLRLATITANRLQGALYVVDEPCQGLTESEVRSVVKVLRELVESGSSVLAVEHHPVFLAMSDEVVVLGPGAGQAGGQIVEHRICKPTQQASRTASAPLPQMAGRLGLRFSSMSVRRPLSGSVLIPQQAVTLLRGPSGTGKLSFAELCLLPVLESLTGKAETAALVPCVWERVGNPCVKGVVEIRPGSITRSSRRTVASALGILPNLRSLYAQLPQSQIMGLSDVNFSWHSRQGSCDLCSGKGYVEVPQRYGSGIPVECERCRGARLTNRSLIPRFKGLNFAEMMQMSLAEAAEHFCNYRLIHQRIIAAVEFGLGYVGLGQGLDSLSGGELQRFVLTLEMRRSNLDGMWFILVHPGTGLHAPDIEILCRLMRQLVQRGATFLAIENREEFLSHADHVVLFS